MRKLTAPLRVWIFAHLLNWNHQRSTRLHRWLLNAYAYALIDTGRPYDG